MLKFWLPYGYKMPVKISLDPNVLHLVANILMLKVPKLVGPILCSNIKCEPCEVMLSIFLSCTKFRDK
jgi:hypothetical protein